MKWRDRQMWTIWKPTGIILQLTTNLSLNKRLMGQNSLLFRIILETKECCCIKSILSLCCSCWVSFCTLVPVLKSAVFSVLQNVAQWDEICFQSLPSKKHSSFYFPLGALEVDKLLQTVSEKPWISHEAHEGHGFSWKSKNNRQMNSRLSLINSEETICRSHWNRQTTFIYSLQRLKFFQKYISFNLNYCCFQMPLEQNIKNEGLNLNHQQAWQNCSENFCFRLTRPTLSKNLSHPILVSLYFLSRLCSHIFCNRNWIGVT